MEKIERLKALIMQAETENYNFYKRNNVAAAVRYRRLLQEARNVAQEIRLDVLKQKTDLANLRYLRRDR